MSKTWSRMIEPWWDQVNWDRWLQQRRKGISEERLTEIAWIFVGGRR